MAVLRRKLAAGLADAQAVQAAGPGLDRAWRLALARAARDGMALPLEVQALRQERVSLAELVELLPERALLAVLDEGGGEGLGLMALAPDVAAAKIEMLTMGRVTPTPAAPRRPTRTDAAMIAPMIDAALAGLELALAGDADLGWAAGYRYASFMEEPRPLGLLLEDVTYRLIRAEVALARGAKAGAVLLALPEVRRLPGRPKAVPADGGARFTADLAAQVAAAEVRLEAVLTRISLPLSRVMALGQGEVLVLPLATLDGLRLEAAGGTAVAQGKLGQSRGMRAVRLLPPPALPGG
jgi:flagellar motor switch protein FliM